jgi:hypothetical protein
MEYDDDEERVGLEVTGKWDLSNQITWFKFYSLNIFTVIEAINLPPMNGDITNAFVELLYGQDIKVNTQTQTKTLNPKWEKEFALRGKFTKLVLEVQHSDSRGKVV